METKKLIRQTAAGTAMMTAFSYALTAATGNDFREPALLAGMFRKKGATHANAKGWLAHVAAGAAWSPILSRMAKGLPGSRPLTRCLALGAFSGIAAVAVWKCIFRLHPAPPRNNRKAFYLQLVAAHALFSLPFSLDRSPRPSHPGNRSKDTP